MSTKTIRAALLAAALALPAAVLAAQVDYFLKIDGVDGESTDDRHKNEIQIESWSWGASTATSPSNNRAGRACVGAFNFAKPVDKSSPLLMANAVSGMAFKQATLSARKAGKGQQEYLKVTLENVLVSSYQAGGASEALPTDQFSLNFSKMTVQYHVQREDGSLGEPITTTFQGGC